MNFCFVKLKRIAFLALFGLIMAGCFIGYFNSAQAEYVKVVDGDSLEIGARRIRLLGIDAPEYKQYCFTQDKQKYDCGREAKRYLYELLKRQNYQLDCRKQKYDRYDRELAVCFSGGQNLNLAMIEAGWAVAYRTHKQAYLAAEKQAKQAKVGVWQGKFMRPEYYRRLNRQ